MKIVDCSNKIASYSFKNSSNKLTHYLFQSNGHKFDQKRPVSKGQMDICMDRRTCRWTEGHTMD